MSLPDRSKALEEYAEADFNDSRLGERLMRILPRLAMNPSESFPEQMGTEGDQEALYRFLRNPKVTIDALLEGHRTRTVARACRGSVVRIVHDTSEFVFNGDREGLGAMRNNAKGFSCHFALVIAGDESRDALGILGLYPFLKKGDMKDESGTAQPKNSVRVPRAERKSSRWETLAIEAANHLPSNVRVIHVMDQEADDYSVFSALIAASQSFVIRGEPRRSTAEKVPAHVALEAHSSTFFREVRLSSRSKAQASSQHPQRTTRVARLQVRASTLSLNRTLAAREAEHASLELGAVHVFEESPPKGEQPIEWMLFTSEPIGTPKEVEAVVDHYRARWVIEEYFKALKTGCAIEKRQLCSYEGLVRALALFVPLAWTLLSLRSLGREATSRPATEIFTVDQVRLLRAIMKQDDRRRLPKNPSVREAMLGIAALGGHIKNNGDPGWQVLGRGLRRFAEMEAGFKIAREM